MYNQVPTNSGTSLAAVITGQTQGLDNDFWSDGWQQRFTECVTEFCERFYKKVRLIEFMNEWDTWDNDDRNDKAVEIGVLGTAICKRYGILGVLGSVSGGDWINELGRACTKLDAIESQVGYSVVHGFAFHPYVSSVERDDGSFEVPNGEGWQRLRDKVRQAIDISGGRACAITECGIKVGDAGGEEQQALYVHGTFQDELSVFSADELLMATYFCWCDQNGAPSERGPSAFGLIDAQGKLRQAYRAALYQYQNAPVVDIPIDRLLSESQAPSQPPIEPPGTIEPPQPVEPPVQIPGKGSLTIEEAHQIRWQAIVHNAPYHHDFGFEKAWRQPDWAWLGAPLTENESVLEGDGRPLRVFANAVVVYNPDGTLEVLN
jgi:hypothetical protein